MGCSLVLAASQHIARPGNFKQNESFMNLFFLVKKTHKIEKSQRTKADGTMHMQYTFCIKKGSEVMSQLFSKILVSIKFPSKCIKY